MSINRVPEIPFAQIANGALRDSRLSFRARGVLAMVLSHTGDWSVNRPWIVEQSPTEGPQAIQTALNELTALGYRAVIKEQDERGHWRTIVQWSHEANKPTDGRVNGPPVDPAVIKNTITEHTHSLREWGEQALLEVEPTPDQQAAEVAKTFYDECGGACNFIAIRTVAKKLIKAGYDPGAVLAALRVAEGSGRPLTVDVLRQTMDGKRQPGGQPKLSYGQRKEQESIALIEKYRNDPRNFHTKEIGS